MTLYRRRGLKSLLGHRFKRIFVPMLLGLFTIIPAIWAVSAYVVPYTAKELAILGAKEAENARILTGGEHRKPLKMLGDYPGVSDPLLVQATKSDLPESTEVIGIEVEGQHYAFVLNSMLKPEHHIVSLVFN